MAGCRSGCIRGTPRRVCLRVSVAGIRPPPGLARRREHLGQGAVPGHHRAHYRRAVRERFRMGPGNHRSARIHTVAARPTQGVAGTRSAVRSRHDEGVVRRTARPRRTPAVGGDPPARLSPVPGGPAQPCRCHRHPHQPVRWGSAGEGRVRGRRRDRSLRDAGLRPRPGDRGNLARTVPGRRGRSRSPQPRAVHLRNHHQGCLQPPYPDRGLGGALARSERACS